MLTEQQVLDFISSKGGSTTYPEIHATLDYRDQRELPNILKGLRKAGKIDQVIEATPEGNVHRLKIKTGS